MYQGRRRKLNRLKNFDYSESGLYFVTICTQNREYLFGRVENGKMILNATGKIVARCWYNLPRHYPNCRLDEFIIMPNHLHGIVVINNIRTVGNRHACSLRNRNRQHQTLPIIIGSFKSAMSKIINKQNNISISIWQKSYYDHIIRNEKEHRAIKKYIYENPLHWLDDRNYMK